VTEGCVLPEGTSCEGTHLTSTAATPPPHQPWPKYSSQVKSSQSKPMSHATHSVSHISSVSILAAQTFLRGAEGVLGTGHSCSPHCQTARILLRNSLRGVPSLHAVAASGRDRLQRTNRPSRSDDFVTTLLAFAVVASRDGRRECSIPWSHGEGSKERLLAGASPERQHRISCMLPTVSCHHRAGGCCVPAACV
jgi:hypothetical protein